VIHGTTLATNALIERKGARTAFIGTEGHRDTLELGYEDRFSEYDVFIEKPAPLIPRDLRFTVPERMSARARCCARSTRRRAAWRRSCSGTGSRAVAIGLLHAYVNPDHERRVARRAGASLPACRSACRAKVCAEVASTIASRPPPATPTSSP
jgi:N-methylhydantoinase A